MPTSTPKTIKINENSFVFQYFLQNRPFEVDIDFWFDFGANMPPFSFQKSIKIGSKLELGRHRFFDRFLHWFFIDFPSIWDANLELCWPLRLLQDASKTPPRRLPRRSARHFSLLVDFWSIFNRFWVDFWLIFYWFLVDLGLIFERFWSIIFWWFFMILGSCLLDVCSSAVAGTQLCCALDKSLIFINLV